MSVIDNAAAHFRDRLSGKPFVIEVPEWGTKDEPLEIYYKPVINLKAKAELTRLQIEQKFDEAVFKMLLWRGMDADGNPLFQAHDKTKFINEVDSDVIDRVYVEISDLDNLEKELKKT